MGTLADLIEIYIKQRLKQSQDQEIELSRAQLAEVFRCVPSQINYVLTTRFTLDRGFIIESRRGGGGYIRVLQIQTDDTDKAAAKLFKQIGTTVSERDLENYLLTFYDLGILTGKQAQVIKGIVQQETGLVEQDKDKLRASLLRAMLCMVLK